MSLYFFIIFLLLVALSLSLLLLLLPLPISLHARVIQLIGTLKANKNVKVVAIMATVAVSMSFLDACKNGMGLKFSDEIVEYANVWDKRARKFYAQRNVYLFGGVLWLEIALMFAFFLVSSLVRNKTKLASLAVDSAKKDETAESDEVEKAKKDVAALQSQYDNLYEAYLAKNGSEGGSKSD
ncbi:hypothetical protein DAMA08_000790 [Martiniozyma asiatica (nom. inval.)]|nr:hypothetical protein DAMA08_000790 [Martiniozyma asiatica]